MRETGGPEVLSLEEVETPEVTSATQVKVRIEAAGVNPVDTKLRSRGLFLPDGTPAVLGCDGAGVVVETGSQVTQFRSGDEVWY
ncbi:MAG: alcohol dehydrogenase catalytic domain-containing protein, partial [Candidatus Thiodiazotropha sp.]